ncbi:MAG: ABC transporter permease [Bacillota bacterium]|nr:ABC transporter permease [Bacillota bacterium]
MKLNFMKNSGSSSEESSVPKKKVLSKQYFPVILLVVLCIIFSIFSPRFLRISNFLVVLQQAIILLVAALGMTFIVIGGSIDLSVGSVVALSAFVAATFSGTMGAAAIIPASLVGLVCGVINGVVFAKGKVPSFILTMGGMVAYRGLVLILTKGAPVQIMNDSFLNVFTGKILGIPNAILITLVITILVYVIFNNLPFGREIRSIGGGERVAIIAGIKVDKVKIIVFTLAGFLYGLTGVLQSARALAATPTLGDGMEMDIIASVVVGGTPLTGGIGSIQGTILGTLIITVLSNGMNMIGVTPEMQYIVKGAVLVLAVFATIDRSKIGIIK